MELANGGTWRIRQADAGDSGEIGRLLSIAPLRHLHVDWNLPVDWIGTPGFVLCERQRGDDDIELAACLAVGADPPPAAWVRVAAVKRDVDAEACLGEMLRPALPFLRDNGVSTLGWLPEDYWPERWLTALGFRKVNWIITYSLDLAGTSMLESDFGEIRPATTADMARLAEIEEEAFEPLWRHSQHGLLLAFGQAMSFDVAEMNGRIVGFQYSVLGQDKRSAHLVRLTVAPEVQGRGVGSSLMRAALLGYAKIGARRVTLNTQTDNHASHRLYERFGFQAAGERTAVWAMAII